MVSPKSTIYDATQLTDDVAAKRRKQIAKSFPQLKREQFASEEAYRTALLEQYRTMRQQEYQYICLSEGIKAYDVTLSICARTGDARAMNRACWNGCKDILQNYPELYDAVTDSCYVRIPTAVTNSLAGDKQSCCAVASKALESKISAEMGFDGDANFVRAYHKGDMQAAYHRAANGFANDPASKGYVVRGNLWKLIEEGKVGPGATVAIRNGITDSGYHAKTVIAVNYDDKGRIKNYVLQANNASKLEVVTHQGKYTNVIVGDMNRWMNEKLEYETQQKRELSTEELSKMLEEERAKLNERIDDLERTESHLFNTKGTYPDVARYADAYIMNAGVPEATPAIIRVDTQNAQKKAEAQAQQVQQKQQKQKTATGQQRASQPAKQAAPQSEPTKESKKAAPTNGNSKDEQRMRDMLNRLNRINGAGKQVDVEETIKSLQERFGENASKILAKAMMSSKVFAAKGLKNDKGKPVSSTREVLQQLCKMDDEKQKQEMLQIKLPSARKRSR